MDPDSAARILDLAEPRGSRSTAVAGFALILALAAHGALVGGFPDLSEHAAMSPATARTSPMESEHMKRLMAIGAAAAMANGAAAQDAVQWRVEDGGNGHWYRVARELAGGSFSAWREWSESQGGHLATMTNAVEHQFILDVAYAQNGLWSAFGCFRNAGATSWMWVTGESLTYAPWAPGEPNASIATAAFAQLWGSGGIPNLTWDDNNSPTGIGGVIMEWSADCNSDGIVDFGQIRNGDLEDSNANNIPDCCEQGTSCFCPGDTNDDGTVDGIDLATVLTRWGQSGSKFPDADCNNDGAIDGSDLAVVLGSWGSCPANAG